MRVTASAIIGLVSLALPSLVNAIPVQASTAILVTARDCVAGPIGACFDLGPTLVSDYRGRPGGLTATTSEVLSGLGTARSHAGLSGPIGAPRIGTFAAGEVDHRVNTNSFALQRYTYVGDTATTREFSGTLTYSLEIPDPNNAQYDIAVASGVHATLIAFTTSAEFAEAGSTAESNFQNLLAFAFGAAPDYVQLATDLFTDLSASVFEGISSLSIDVELNPGDSMWIFALLQTPAANGSTVDSFGTLVTGWDDTTDLIPARAFVPEPGSLALMLFGLVGLRFVRHFSRDRHNKMAGLLALSAAPSGGCSTRTQAIYRIRHCGLLTRSLRPAMNPSGQAPAVSVSN
jgi:PEP-CTERM motif-containing protein